jgi:hypothetical protein
MLKFLRLCTPLDQDDMFTRLVLRPLKNGDPGGGELLGVRVRSALCSRTVYSSPHRPSWPRSASAARRRYVCRHK